MMASSLRKLRVRSVSKVSLFMAGCDESWKIHLEHGSVEVHSALIGHYVMLYDHVVEHVHEQ